MPVDVKEVYKHQQLHQNDVAYRAHRRHNIVMNNKDSTAAVISSSMTEEEVIPLACSLEEDRKRLLSQIYKQRSNLSKLKLIQHQNNSHSTKADIESVLLNIQLLETSLSETQMQLEEYSNHISNIPDDTDELYKKLAHIISTNNIPNNYPKVDPPSLYSLGDNDREVAATLHLNNGDDNGIDPLWCIGGCEYYSLDITNRKTNIVDNKLILTGVGYSLHMAIQMYAISYMKQHHPTNTCSWELLHLPDVNVDNHHLSNIIGCSCGTAQTKAAKIPSNVLLSCIHTGKTYADHKALPVTQIVIPSKEEVEIFSICKSSLSSSRTIQIQMAYRIAQFHLSLLNLTTMDSNTKPCITIIVGQEDTNKTTDSPPSILRIRILPNNLLLSAESSKIIVEGLCLPTRNTKNKCQPYVELGHVTNFTDYISRHFNTKCSSNSKDYVHTIHGLFCNTTNTISWMLQNNQRILTMADKFSQKNMNTTTSNYGTASSDNSFTILRGCILNPCLVTFLTGCPWFSWKESTSPFSTVTLETIRQHHHPTLLFLPFHRRIVRGKKDGKKQIVFTESGKFTSHIGLYTIQNLTETSGDDKGEAVPLSSDSHFQRKKMEDEVQKQQTSSVPLCFQNVNVENPFDFLPIYN